MFELYLGEWLLTVIITSIVTAVVVMAREEESRKERNKRLASKPTVEVKECRPYKDGPGTLRCWTHQHRLLRDCHTEDRNRRAREENE